jgi:hypothetical protein
MNKIVICIEVDEPDYLIQSLETMVEDGNISGFYTLTVNGTKHPLIPPHRRDINALANLLVGRYSLDPELTHLLREFFVFYPVYAHGVCCYNDLRREAKRDQNFNALPALTRLHDWVENVVIYNTPAIDKSEV